MWNNRNGIFKAYATLRIHGDGLSPETISSQLALEPSKSGVHNNYGMWSYSSRQHLDTLLPLERHVRFITELLKPRQAALRELQRKCKTDVFCYFSSQSDMGGFSLSPETLRELGELGLTFDVDEYFCAEAETNENQTA
jgi:hypothetical protein